MTSECGEVRKKGRRVREESRNGDGLSPWDKKDYEPVAPARIL